METTSATIRRFVILERIQFPLLFTLRTTQFKIIRPKTRIWIFAPISSWIVARHRKWIIWPAKGQRSRGGQRIPTCLWRFFCSCSCIFTDYRKETCTTNQTICSVFDLLRSVQAWSETVEFTRILGLFVFCDFYIFDCQKPYAHDNFFF